MNENGKGPTITAPNPDPLHAEAQLYQRIEQARAALYGMVNTVSKDSGLPTAIILEILRGVVAETSLMLERAGKAALRAEVEEAVGGVREAAKAAGDDQGDDGGGR